VAASSQFIWRWDVCALRRFGGRQVYRYATVNVCMKKIKKYAFQTGVEEWAKNRERRKQKKNYPKNSDRVIMHCRCIIYHTHIHGYIRICVYILYSMIYNDISTTVVFRIVASEL